MEKKIVVEKFDINKRIDKIVQLYETLVKSKLNSNKRNHFLQIMIISLLAR